MPASLSVQPGSPLSVQPNDPAEPRTDTQPNARLSVQPITALSTQSKSAEHSAKPKKHRRLTDTQPKQNPVVVQISARRSEAFDETKWKRSRKRDGHLIRRIKGYSLAETEYGVSYLGVVSRKPDRTSADKSRFGFAGYFNWASLEKTGLLVKERNHAKEQRRSAG